MRGRESKLVGRWEPVGVGVVLAGAEAATATGR